MAATQAHDSHGSHGHHVTPISVGVMVYLSLLLFMALTVGASYVHFPDDPKFSFISNAIALTIAIIKAVLVIMFFMGAKYSTKLTKMFVVLGFAWASLMFIMFADYSTRKLEPVKGWEPVSPTALGRMRDNNDAREYSGVGTQPIQP